MSPVYNVISLCIFLYFQGILAKIKALSAKAYQWKSLYNVSYLLDPYLFKAYFCKGTMSYSMWIF